MKFLQVLSHKDANAVLLAIPSPSTEFSNFQICLSINMGPNSYKIHSVSKTKTNQFMQFREINIVNSNNEIIPVHIVWVKSSFWILNCVCVWVCVCIRMCLHTHTHKHEVAKLYTAYPNQLN